MNDVLGALDVLESHVMAAKNVPFSQNIIVNEQEVLDMVDKIRQLIIKESQGSGSNANAYKQGLHKSPKESANDVIAEAEKEAAHLAFESRQYADDIFIRLQVMVAKLRKNLVRLDQNIEEGREMLENLESDGQDTSDIPSEQKTKENNYEHVKSKALETR